MRFLLGSALSLGRVFATYPWLVRELKPAPTISDAQPLGILLASRQVLVGR